MPIHGVWAEWNSPVHRRYAVLELLISSIRRDINHQPRANLSLELITEYAESVKRGDSFPPIKVVRDKDGVYWCWNGHHRLNAFEQAGKKTIPVDISEGSERDAFRLSLGANADNGLRRSNDDKRRAVTLALKDEEFVKLSDSAISELCAVDRQTVANVRSEMESACEIRTLKNRVGKDGKEYKVKESKPKAEEPKKKPKLYGVTEEVGSLEGEPAATKAGKAAEPVAQDEPPARPLVNPTKDKHGNQIPTNLVPIFADPVWGEIDGTCSKLTQLLDKAAKSPGGYFLTKDMEDKNGSHRLTSFEHAKNSIHHCRPYGVCPGCGGDGCKHCYQKGYLCKLTYKQVEGVVS